MIYMRKVILRGDRSGVFYGTIEKRTGTEVLVNNCRRLWYWDGANSISELAVNGTKESRNCKFTVSVDSVEILDIIEILDCTIEAIASIESVEVWKY